MILSLCFGMNGQVWFNQERPSYMQLYQNIAMDNRTIEYYDSHAAEFAAGTENADMSECRSRFLSYLEPGQTILDAGCGSGRDMAAFMNAGFAADGFDASPELCRIASKKTGRSVRQLRFEELDGEEKYDAIWACASLLHVTRAELPDVLLRLYRLLKTGGIFYASFKYGNGERMKEGRYFRDLEEEEGKALMEEAGFSVKEVFITRDVRPNRYDEKWINFIMKKY